MMVVGNATHINSTKTKKKSCKRRKSKKSVSPVFSSDILSVNNCKYNRPSNFISKPLCVATWNTTTLVNNSSKLYQLCKVMDDYKLELLGITETHMPGKGTLDLENGGLLLYSGSTEGVKRKGVGIALSKKVKNSLISYTPVSERIMTARLHSQQINISVVVAYAPIQDDTATVKDKFYEELEAVQSKLPGHDVKIVMGDFNARVGQDPAPYHGVIGKHSCHETANDNGNRLLDFCVFNELTIGGTLFEHKDNHKYTWYSRDKKTVAQIDHICISRKWSHSLLDVRVCRGADIGSDHRLVRGYIRLKLKATHQKRMVQRKVPDVEKLRNKEMIDEYNAALQVKFRDADNVNKSLEESWDYMKSSIKDASLEVLGVRPKKKRDQHLSDATRRLLNERNDLRKKKITEANTAEYSKVNKLAKKSTKNDDERWANRIAGELEQAASHGHQREVWQKVKVLQGKDKKPNAAVRDKDNNLVSEPVAQLERWREYFSELLNPEPTTVDIGDLDGEQDIQCFQNLADDDGPPSLFEIEGALKRLKNHKSPGIDEISNEQLKYGKDGLGPWIKEIFDKVWQEEKIPEDWLKGVITIVPKKGDTSYCGNNRGITLRSTVSKLYQIIILQRLNLGLEELLRDNQCGFRRGRSCIDQLHSLRTIIINSINYNIPLYVNFVDFKSAFDCINREFMFKAFRHYGLPCKYVRILYAFFDGTMSAVRVNGELTDWFKVLSGTGQGDIQGPPCFNVVINWIMELAIAHKTVSRGAVLQKRQSSRFPEVTISDIDYADDLGALDNTKEGLQETTDNIAKFAAYGGLRLNVAKTKTMSISKSASQPPYLEKDTLETTVYGSEIEQVSEFTYLGSIISNDGKIDREISVRIGKASGAFNCLYNIWNNKGITRYTKIRIYKAAVVTILTYGAEVWNTTMTQMKRLEVFHQSCLRRILKVRFYHHVTNVSVLKQTRCTTIEQHIATMRLRWFGHVARMPDERLPKYLLNWTPKYGSRSAGYQRRLWTKTVEEDFNNFTEYDNLNSLQIQSIAADRKIWRGIVRKCNAIDNNEAGSSQSEET